MLAIDKENATANVLFLKDMKIKGIQALKKMAMVAVHMVVITMRDLS